jgi:hypothetical protein
MNRWVPRAKAWFGRRPWRDSEWPAQAPDLIRNGIAIRPPRAVMGQPMVQRRSRRARHPDETDGVKSIIMVCPPASLYTELKAWQGAIGAVFGFIALVTGALVNFRLTRRRDDLVRKEEALSVAAALYSEIVLLRKEAARLATAVARVYLDGRIQKEPIFQFDIHFFEEYTLSDPNLYEALAPRLGLLATDLVLAITEFHNNIQQARIWLPRLAENADRKYTYGPLYVLSPASNAVRNIVPALRRIEAMAGIAVPAPEKLEMRIVETVIEMEEELSSVPSEAGRTA